MKIRPVFRTALLLSFAFLITSAAAAQSKITYDISFPNLVHHEAEISAVFEKLPAGKPLQMVISRSSPGRYSAHDFARNVYKVRAVDAKGKALEITRPHPNEWDVVGITASTGKVTVSYTLFGDLGSGTFTGIDNTMCHISMPATIMWARGMDDLPIEVRFRLPVASWKVATQLVPTSNPEIFTAPHLQYLMDSPTMLGEIRFREWEVKSGAKTYKMRLAINDSAPDSDVDAFTEAVKRVVDEEIAVWGMPADYDFGTYTFLCNYVPQIGGDGMEHRNSTSLTSSRSIASAPGNGPPMPTDPTRPQRGGGGRGGAQNNQAPGRGNLGTVAHEFFHSWNVERLRPASIEPFRFDEPNVSGELWLAEGFTQYYGGLAMKRAGYSGDDDSFARGLGFTLNAVINTPGRSIHGPYLMSQRAVFEDGAGLGSFPNNSQNLFLSYYTYGSAVATGLDLTLRTKFKDKSLDGYMRELWQSYGKLQKNYNPLHPYNLADLEVALARYTGDAAFAKDFFARYIKGNEVMDYAGLLAKAGMVMRKVAPGKAWVDLPLREEDGKLVVPSVPNWNGPAYKAGIDRLDIILSVDGQPVSKAGDLNAIIAKASPGSTLNVEILQRRVKKTVQIKLEEDPRVEVLTMERAGQEPTAEMKALRADWLSSKVGK